MFDFSMFRGRSLYFQPGIIDCGMSDHQLTFSTRKVKRAKFDKHNKA